MSILLNLASAVLILPIVSLAAFFLAVEVAARQTLGSFLSWFGRLLLSLPEFTTVIAGMIGLLLAAVALIYLMVRFHFLLPLTIILLGVAASAHVVWATAAEGAAGNPLLWAAVVGVGLAAAQFRRAVG
jgi:hypothetical protein